MTSSRFAHSALSLALASCAELGERELGVCGNGIVEPSFEENCDGEADCIGPGEPSECQFSCADRACPRGAACGLDGVCRAPADAFELSTLGGDRPVPWVEATDLDGDGKAELLWVEADQPVTPGNRDVALHVTRFDTAREPDSWSLDDEASIPSLDDIDDNGLVDMVLGLPDNNVPGVVALRQDDDGGFTPLNVVRDIQDGRGVHSIHGIGAGQVPLLQTSDSVLRGGQPLVSGAEAMRWPDALAVRTLEEEVFALAYVAGGAPAAVAEPDRAFTGPVRWTVVEGQFGPEGWGTLPIPSTITLETEGGPEAVGVAYAYPWIRFADVDGDDTADLVVGVAIDPADIDEEDAAVLVAYAVSDPYGPLSYQGFSDAPLALVCSDAFERLRLADLDQDGTLDLVGPIDPDKLPPAGPAAIADINGDGWLDVVLPFADAATGWLETRLSSSGSFVYDTLALPGPARAVAAEDFDADGRTDLVVQISESRTGPWPSALYIRWGAHPEQGFVPVVTGVQMLGMATNPQSTGDQQRAAELLVPMRLSAADVSEQEVGLATLRSVAGALLAAPVPTQRGSWRHTFALQTGPGSDTDLRLARIGRPGSNGVSSIWTAELGRLDQWQFLRERSSQTITEEGILGAAGWSEQVHGVAVDLDGDGNESLLTFAADDPEGTEFGPTQVRELSFRGDDVRYQGVGTIGLRFGPTASIVAPGDDVSRANAFVAFDLDDDFDSDLFTLVEPEEGRGRRTPALGRNEDGAIHWEPLDMDVPELGSWSFTTPDLSRALCTTETVVLSGSADLSSGKFEATWETPLPAAARWSTQGDLDGDGLIDVALATDLGVQIFWGTPGYGDAS